MKKSIVKVFALLFMTMMYNCARMPVSQETGIDNVAHLLFVSFGNRSAYEVKVTLDDGSSFVAQTIKAKNSSRKGTQYVVRTGRRKLKVMEGNTVLYEKEVFLSTGETKEILLP